MTTGWWIIPAVLLGVAGWAYIATVAAGCGR
jgi:hypothetical protein